MAARRRSLLGQLLVKEGLITKAQLQEALRVQATLRPYALFEQILVEWNIITQAQLNPVLDKYEKKHRLGSILVEMKAISEEQLGLAVEHQQKTGTRLGDVHRATEPGRPSCGGRSRSTCWLPPPWRAAARDRHGRGPGRGAPDPRRPASGRDARSWPAGPARCPRHDHLTSPD